jgi:transcriptional regulator with PAS, ATPase and Fis domain
MKRTVRPASLLKKPARWSRIGGTVEEVQMDIHSWVREFPGAVTVCDAEGRIVGMNDKSVEAFTDDGGACLIGTDVLDCHAEPSRSKLKDMMEKGRTNVYTIQKKGKKKLIYQSPWYKNGRYAGFVEISFEIPWDMPHFNRD